MYILTLTGIFMSVFSAVWGHFKYEVQALFLARQSRFVIVITLSFDYHIVYIALLCSIFAYSCASRQSLSQQTRLRFSLRFTEV